MKLTPKSINWTVGIGFVSLMLGYLAALPITFYSGLAGWAANCANGSSHTCSVDFVISKTVSEAVILGVAVLVGSHLLRKVYGPSYNHSRVNAVQIALLVVGLNLIDIVWWGHLNSRFLVDSHIRYGTLVLLVFWMAYPAYLRYEANTLLNGRLPRSLTNTINLDISHVSASIIISMKRIALIIGTFVALCLLIYTILYKATG